MCTSEVIAGTTVYVVIVTKEGCSPNSYVYMNKEDAIKQYCYYRDIGVPVVLGDVELC